MGKGNKSSGTTRLPEELKAELRKEQAPYLSRGLRDLLAQQVVTVGGYSIVSEHIDEESLERYALGRPLASESEWIEEHLLVCGPCREALVILDRFIPAMRDALGKIGGAAAYAARK